ncbi:S-formylglutathione hydrolase [Vibrio neptunius]|uniref:S-formylglutathione hydrolase n=1 Tax=Vibrio neptunius TaxID=170651 RepID=A0ABS3A506_9VIBR|nr:S-formylglutathione hydrolase [Vibrio neptunius]KJY88394.1 S-formylglutathione hydrolase [Vibrio neptunius]MBN3494683.1 S-formylglutathione hydrolase [Vibrio neptunius]MBN3517171.1 S-formylglutathione hydrolase [Vibrio neptunius]MBN3551275.1 S-formylglutathione hydrolase [Vibrio neptunius]MBN3579566.1 S-formylglutathione hydrolase [Vibrio neptunius]
MSLSNISQNKVAGGWHKQYTHASAALNCTMRFAIFLPPNASKESPAPVLYWLSGLTCSDENFMQKAGAFKKAAELGIAIVAPDTSPRGEDVADDEGYDLGKGAGFYLNATQEPWSTHYHMYDYIAQELPKVIEANFPISTVKAISGHSMGGHGALTIGLKNAGQFTSISAFSPICNPMQCPWGQKAFNAYLGNDFESWKEYDSSELLKLAKSPLPILVDQGDADNFLVEQLKPETLIATAETHGSDLELRMQTGYDHSYYFIASFIDEHLMFHAKHMFK